jgi:hypothetical protein
MELAAAERRRKEEAAERERLRRLQEEEEERLRLEAERRRKEEEERFSNRCHHKESVVYAQSLFCMSDDCEGMMECMLTTRICIVNVFWPCGFLTYWARQVTAGFCFYLCLSCY